MALMRSFKLESTLSLGMLEFKVIRCFALKIDLLCVEVGLY